ncbi:2-iminobutanoate/2-iminopropanoate deaminase isoform X2 [Bacillus rossius redtenbacheri]|uniref:2-iminobutanoate/2-iminopropanoate deaminase isoform X2 n=1 Tax=Bacillus rossius redtenbacheri TaxID=93214 RepID=UPI002FDCE3AF
MRTTHSQAVQVGHTLYLSGVVGNDKDSAKLVSGGVVQETKQAFENLGKLLEAGGSSFANVVKTTVLLKDINNFKAVNDIYQEHFKEPYPARVAYQVGKLPLDAEIEIDAVAVTGELETTYVNV